MNKLFLLLLLPAVLMQFSCTKEDVKPNVTGTASGTAYDDLNQEPYAGLIVTVSEYQVTSDIFTSHASFVGVIGTGVTDANGHYSFKYTTTGRGNTYYLSLGKFASNVSQVLPVNSLYQFEPYQYDKIQQITNVGGSLNYNFIVRKQYYMKSEIIVANDLEPPLFPVFQSTRVKISGGIQVFGKSNDTTVYIPIFKNTGGFNIYFYVANPKGDSARFSNLMPLNPLINKDTIDGPVYKLDVSTFK